MAVLALPSAAADDGTENSTCTTTDYSFADPEARTGPFYAISGTPPNWIQIVVVVNEPGPTGPIWLSAHVVIDVNECVP